MKNLAIIVPVYNEEDNIKLVVSELKKLTKLIEHKYDVQVVLINDGSRDKTKELIAAESENFKNLKNINFTRNFGYVSVITAGLEKINADLYACVDGDLQKNPKHILSMLETMEKDDIDVVQMVTKRDQAYENPLKFQLSIFYYKLLNYISKSKTKDGACDFWLIKKIVRNKFLQNPNYLNFIRASFTFFKFKIKYLEYNALKRKFGISKFNLKKQIELGLYGIFLLAKKKYLLYLILIPLFIIILSYLIYLFSIKIIFGNFSSINILYLLFFVLSQILVLRISLLIVMAFNKIQKKPKYIIKQS